MQNQIWKSKEINGNLLKVLGKNTDGSIAITFDMGLNPKRINNYQEWYLKHYYEYAGYTSYWSHGKGFKSLR
jgi:hypothetical protein